MWFENVNGLGTSWTDHTLDAGSAARPASA
jgi:hypothetical protein